VRHLATTVLVALCRFLLVREAARLVVLEARLRFLAVPRPVLAVLAWAVT